MKTTTFPGRLARLLLASLVAVAAFGIHAAEALDFAHRPLLAGKASLVGPGFEITRTLGVAAFAPELRLPVELVYDSSSEASGAFGFGWRSPQLESSVRRDRGGVLWTAPWGEKFKFFPKKEKTPKDAVRIEPIEAAKRGRGLYSPYSDWEADCGSEDPAKARLFTVTGKNGRRGWSFAYADGRLLSIATPNGASVEFAYGDAGELLSVSSRKTRFVELSYSDGLVSSLRVNGVPVALGYAATARVALPKTVDGRASRETVRTLSSIRVAGLDAETFGYANGYLASATRGKCVERLAVDTETPENRLQNLKCADPGARPRIPAGSRDASSPTPTSPIPTPRTACPPA